MLSQSRAIDLSDKQSEAWHYLEDNSTTELLYGGGAGGGKSYLGCLWHVHRRTAYPGSRGMIGRAKIAALEESTLITLKNVCKQLGYVEGYDFFYNSQKHTITWRNGSKTILKDLFLYPADPDFISLGSTEYTDVFIEEGNEVTLKAFEIANSRVRYKLDEFGLIPKTLVTCNPGQGWIKDRFISDIDGNRVTLQPYQKFVQSLVIDNPDEVFIKLYTSQLEKITSDYDKQRLLYGDWDAVPSVKNPVAHAYKKEKHESETALFNPSRQIILALDFNLNPFAGTLRHFWQDSFGLHWHVFDEFEIDNGSIPEMIDFLKNGKYGRYWGSALLTGDAMGKKREMSQRDLASNYKQLIRGLGMSESQLKVPANPYHANSRADMAYVHVHFPDYKIHPKNCPNLCRDMKTVQWDDLKGEIVKRNRSDVKQRADYFDTERYGINTFLSPRIDRHQKTGVW